MSGLQCVVRTELGHTELLSPGQCPGSSGAGILRGVSAGSSVLLLPCNSSQMFAKGSAQKNFKVQPKYLQSQCLSCQASVSHLVSRIEQFHAGQPPAAPEGWCCCQRGQRIPLFWRGTCADLQPLPTGTDSSLLVLCVQGRLWVCQRSPCCCFGSWAGSQVQ